ncbi:MAG TPA: hypothetical protein VEL74_10125 [Thermoanaerobaculia bacterium]|nr:hypothetical protein [Thermoanaerobaculia bacterium]
MRSTDSGLSWGEATPGGPAFLGSLFADPFQSGRLFAATEESSTGPTRVAVWRTADAGRSWARRHAGLPVTCTHIASVDVCPSLYAVTSDPRNPDRMLMSFGGSGGLFSADPGVYVSPNGGRRWQLAAQSPPGIVISFAVDPTPSGTVFLAGTSKGIYRSADGGNHWSKLATSGLPVDAAVRQLLHDGQSGAWYAVTEGEGIFRSTDGGTTWAGINAGLPDVARPVVVVDPQAPGRLFAAVRGQGLWSWSTPGS